MRTILFAAILLAAGPISQAAAQAEKVKILGTVEIAVDPDKAMEPSALTYKGSVFFQFPQEDERGYRVDVVISKPNRTPPIDSKRIDLWLLAKNSKILTVKDRPRQGPLLEVNSAGTSASAIYFFQRDVGRADLVAVVVSIDGKLYTFKVSAPGEKAPAAPVAPPAKPGALPVSVRADFESRDPHAAVAEGASLPLSVTIRNDLGNSIGYSNLSLKPNQWNGEVAFLKLVDVYRDSKPENLVLEQPQVAVPPRVAGFSVHEIKAHATLEVVSDLRKWKIASGWIPGQYEARMRVDNLVLDGGRCKLSVESNPFTFRIK